MLPQCEGAEYLAHEPPHVPWPLQEAILVIAGDGVHGEYDRLGTFALRLQPLFGLLAIHPNQYMGDESLKFVGNAHPGVEQKLAPIVHERPFDATCMPLQRFLYRLRLEPRAHGKVPSVQVTETDIVPHAHARIPEQHRAKVEGPNRIFATDSIEVAMSVRREQGFSRE